jgi:hypothetical protein
MSDHDRRHVLRLDGGHPPLRKDIRRNLRAGSARLRADHARAVVRFTVGRAELEALRGEITAAWEARNLDRDRPLDRAGWERIWRRTAEAGTLRVGGKLAAWTLAGRARPWWRRLLRRRARYPVLAGQLAPGGEPYRAARLLEHALIGRVLTDSRFAVIDWGRGHPGALIARTER